MRFNNSCAVGKYPLFDAFHRVLQAAETLAVYALIVDAKNDEALVSSFQ